MATITQADPAANRAAPAADADERILLRDIPWPVYEGLRDLRANYHVRMTYDDGRLELMSPGQRHEAYGFRFGMLLVNVAAVLGIKCRSLATTTWKKEGETKGKEADACF